MNRAEIELRRYVLIDALRRNAAAIKRIEDAGQTRPLNAKQKAALATNKATRKRYTAELKALPPITNPDAWAMPVWPAEPVFTEATEDPDVKDLIYQQGGSRPVPEHPEMPGARTGEPNGVSFTPALARQWFEIVRRDNVDYGRVASAMTPGGAILTEAGKRYFEQRGIAIKHDPNAVKAPADYNPLGLQVIP